MKNRVITSFLLTVITVFSLSAQSGQLPESKNPPLDSLNLRLDSLASSVKFKEFEMGEKLTYICHYGMVNIGEGVVRLDKKIHNVNNRPSYKVEVDGKTIGLFKFSYKVKDHWASYIDTAAMIPNRFYRNISENSYKLEETSDFDYRNSKVKVEKNKKGKKSENSYDVPLGVQDLISGYYWLRSLDYDSYSEGDTLNTPAFLEDELYNFKIRYLGKEKVWTPFGKIDSFVMSPIMPKNDLFEGQDAIKFWVSDDVNRVPLKVEATMFILGSIDVELVKHDGLAGKLGQKAKTD